MLDVCQQEKLGKDTQSLKSSDELCRNFVKRIRLLQVADIKKEEDVTRRSEGLDPILMTLVDPAAVTIEGTENKVAREPFQLKEMVGQGV